MEAHRNRQLELLKLTRLNTSQMVKEIAGLRHSLIFEKATVAKVEGAMIRMQNQIEALQREVRKFFFKFKKKKMQREQGSEKRWGGGKKVGGSRSSIKHWAMYYSLFQHSWSFKLIF